MLSSQAHDAMQYAYAVNFQKHLPFCCSGKTNLLKYTSLANTAITNITLTDWQNSPIYKMTNTTRTSCKISLPDTDKGSHGTPLFYTPPKGDHLHSANRTKKQHVITHKYTEQTVNCALKTAIGTRKRNSELSFPCKWMPTACYVKPCSTVAYKNRSIIHTHTRPISLASMSVHTIPIPIAVQKPFQLLYITN
jgi:hypothetical protein